MIHITCQFFFWRLCLETLFTHVYLSLFGQGQDCLFFIVKGSKLKKYAYKCDYPIKIPYPYVNSIYKTCNFIIIQCDGIILKSSTSRHLLQNSGVDFLIFFFKQIDPLTQTRQTWLFSRSRKQCQNIVAMIQMVQILYTMCVVSSTNCLVVWQIKRLSRLHNVCAN